MVDHGRLPLYGGDEDAALRSILEGTATETGGRFFIALVKSLARALGTRGAWVTEYIAQRNTLRSFAFSWDGECIEDYEYIISGTPCEIVIREGRLTHHPDNVVELFPKDPDLVRFEAVSYMGAPLIGNDNQVLGNLAVMDTRPLPREPRYEAVMRIFAARASAEVERLRADAALREREEQLSRLVDSAMDAIIQLDSDLRVVRANAATETAYRCEGKEILGQDFTRFLTEEGTRRLQALVGELESREDGRRFLWVPGGLEAVCPDGARFPAEATLSRFEQGRQTYYTVILRNVNERLHAERQIRSLQAETQYLREEVRTLGEFDEILGESAVLRRVLDEIEQVAATDSTVLLLGETGTGKELFARAVHAASRRRNRPMVKVNCAAIPTSLIESELFGHEKGAFTGATVKRDGRFTLADGGTIFLDEIGELPVDLQVKLLRVLQEGEFEPVGSSQTRSVDVRVIAATNRDLERALEVGEFREDLYYRLNVFPIRIPPLRERGDDVVLLANAFSKKFAQRIGRTVQPLSESCIRGLKAYSWPGNVRELQNLVERAVIVSRGGVLDLASALPGSFVPCATPGQVSYDEDANRIWTTEELQQLERSNILRALEAADWKVSGKNGAAVRLGMNPSTLNSRMRSLGIKRASPG